MSTQKPSLWHERAANLRPATQAFIDGRYVPSLSGATFQKKSPIDGRLIAEVASCDTADVEVAVASARKAFESGVWSAKSPVQRKRVLKRFAELILKYKEDLALLETLDMGKPISDSLKVDVTSSARCIEWYAEAIDKIYGEVAPTGPNSLATIT
ncbi:MAG: aldehyde dehydrogenase family protein, partial [Gammaproteobacteria bacterium]|nr:aldehyde dehydrogenase family protein [Gammaproteobacteria bacterium]